MLAVEGGLDHALLARDGVALLVARGLLARAVDVHVEVHDAALDGQFLYVNPASEGEMALMDDVEFLLVYGI